MQWGGELSQQWSSDEFRQIRVCNQKGQKGSTGRLSVAVACVMSAAGFPRIPDATPGLKVLGRLYPNIAWIRLVGSEQ